MKTTCPPSSFLVMKEIIKEFAGHHIIANNRVSIEAKRGEIHALIGENGAGKSTLMNIAAGFLQPDSGRIFIDGGEHTFHSPHEALKNGVGMVYQQQRLLGELEVWENIVLGEPFHLFTKAGKEKLFRTIEEIQETYSIPFPPRKKTYRLTLPEQFYVSLAILLLKNVTCVILDEPTSTFSTRETQNFYLLLEKLKEEGKAVILITHKIEEMYHHADRFSVMRKGNLLLTSERGKISKNRLLTLMMGENVSSPSADNEKKITPGENPLMEVRNLKKMEKSSPLLGVEHFVLYPGEIVAVSGIRSRALEILENCLSGMDKPDSGTITFAGEDISSLSRREMKERGFAYVPTNRSGRGAALQARVMENIILGFHGKLGKKGILKNSRVKEFASRLINTFSIKADPEQPLYQLSGGNVQRVIIARELSSEPLVTLFSDPGMGLDMKAKRELYDRLRNLKNRGNSVLLISSDIDEILSVSDRIYIIYEGELLKVPKEFQKDRDSIGKFIISGRISHY